MCKAFIWYDTKKKLVYGDDFWSGEEQFITWKLEIFAVITGHDQENAIIVLYVSNVNQ